MSSAVAQACDDGVQSIHAGLFFAFSVYQHISMLVDIECVHVWLHKGHMQSHGQQEGVSFSQITVCLQCCHSMTVITMSPPQQGLQWQSYMPLLVQNIMGAVEGKGVD